MAKETNKIYNRDIKKLSKMIEEVKDGKEMPDLEKIIGSNSKKTKILSRHRH
ncbi:MAG: hypothetical protein NWF01_05805 [Candidatus Bathyarchaeota archaeon]|nr:hypothetical protein [Candidatus Bathyarchaeota archaeon]